MQAEFIPLSACLSIGDAVRPGVYKRITRFDRSVLWMDATASPLFLVSPEIGAGPLNIVVEQPGDFARSERISIPPPPAEKQYDSSLPAQSSAGLSKIQKLLAERLHDFADPDSLISIFHGLTGDEAVSPHANHRRQVVLNALEKLKQNQWSEGIGALKGLGPGLTPSGDDFICGLLLAMNLTGRGPVEQTLGTAFGGNAISNAFLELAAQGRTNQAVNAFLERPSSRTLFNVCLFGHTSGADLLCGLHWGLDFFQPA